MWPSTLSLCCRLSSKAVGCDPSHPFADRRSSQAHHHRSHATGLCHDQSLHPRRHRKTRHAAVRNFWTCSTGLYDPSAQHFALTLLPTVSVSSGQVEYLYDPSGAARFFGMIGRTVRCLSPSETANRSSRFDSGDPRTVDNAGHCGCQFTRGLGSGLL